jgi:hypothetical protein
VVSRTSVTSKPQGNSQGQATVELIFGVILLALTIAMASALALSLRQGFKHDYLSTSGKSNDRFSQDELTFKKDLILFDFKSKLKQDDQLISSGWQASPLKIPGQAHFKIYKKNNEELLLINNLGVITCSKNCN